MGWSWSAYHICKLTHTFINYLRRPSTPSTTKTATPHKPSKRFLRNIRWRGIRLLPYMDDLLFIAYSREAALLLRDRVEAQLHRLGLQRIPKKGMWEPKQVGDHVGLTILQNGELRAAIDKLQALSKHTSALPGLAVSTACWLPAKKLTTFA
jgi:hypothetical protein